MRNIAQRVGIDIGTALYTLRFDDPQYLEVAAREFSSVTPENEMKWESLEPEPGRYTFEGADRIVDFAQRNGQRIWGHTLVWHSQLPGWLAQGNFSSEQLKTLLKNHIQAVVGRYRGKVSRWDVVNEAFNEDGTLRDTIWSRAFGGPEYIAQAFRWAHEADPNALLFYNDYNLEFPGPKADAVLQLLTQLRAQGVPIHGVGFQGHLSLRYGFPDASTLVNHLKRFTDAGFYIAFTEVDVRMALPRNTVQELAQAQLFSQLLSACLALPRCLSYTVWGFPDKYSWVPDFFPGEGDATPFNNDYTPKPAYHQLRLTLALSGGAPARVRP